LKIFYGGEASFRTTTNYDAMARLSTSDDTSSSDAVARLFSTNTTRPTTNDANAARPTTNDANAARSTIGTNATALFLEKQVP
jgi:hypothetical protein